MSAVLVAEGDLAALEGDQALVAECDPVSVAAEIAQDLFGTSGGWLAVDVPVGGGRLT